MLNAVSATSAISRRPILVAFYDTHGDTDDTFSTLTPGPHGGRAIYIDIAFIINLVDSRTAREDKRSIPYVRENIPTRPRLTPRAKRGVPVNWETEKNEKKRKEKKRKENKEKSNEKKRKKTKRKKTKTK